MNALLLLFQLVLGLPGFEDSWDRQTAQPVATDGGGDTAQAKESPFPPPPPRP
jgi:hypothetical protein